MGVPKIDKLLGIEIYATEAKGIGGIIRDSIDDFKVEGVLEANNTIIPPVSYDLKFYRSKIYFQVPNSIGKTPVKITLFNSQGKAVRTLVNDQLTAGSYSVSMERYNNNLAAGLYLCRMEAGSFTKTINVAITK